MLRIVALTVLPACLANAQTGTLQTSPVIPAPGAARATSLVPDVLPASDAFMLTAFVEAETDVALLWEMPPGYYLYRKSLHLESSDGTPLEPFEVPEGETLEDEFFGESEVYFERLLLRLPLSAIPEKAFARAANGDRHLELLVSYQGCAQDKYCYPPQYLPVTLDLP